MIAVREHMQAPIVIPRWALVVKYALFVLLGVAIWIASAPSVDTLAPDWYTPLWGAGISASSTVALIGSIRERWEPFERWSVATLACLLVSYPVASIVLVLGGDEDRAAFSVAALVVFVLPAARALQLLRRTGAARAGG